MGYLDYEGLGYFFTKIKNVFAPKSHGHGGATQSAAGFMSAADKKKLDGIAEGANKYNLPTATSSVLGGVKTGANITNSSGTISLTETNVTTALGYTPPTSDTWRGIQNNLTSDSTTDSLSAAQGKALKALVDSKAAGNHTHTVVNGIMPEYSGSIGFEDTNWIAAWSPDGKKIKAMGKNSFAKASHTHAYLPLAGGTVTGATAFTNTTASTNKSTGAVKVSGGMGVAGRMSANEVMIGDGCTLMYNTTNKCVDFVFS